MVEKSSQTVIFSHYGQGFEPGRNYAIIRSQLPAEQPIRLGSAVLHRQTLEAAGGYPSPGTTMPTNGEFNALPSSFLAILHNSEECQPITTDELRVATENYGESAVPYLVTTTILHCMDVHGTMIDYRRSRDAEVEIKKIKEDRWTSKVKKTAAIESLQEELELLKPTAGQYADILAIVRAQEEVFKKRYTSNERVDRDALGQLFDRTDPLQHPAVTAMAALQNRRGETIIAGTQAATQQAILLRTEWLLRHILDRAFYG